MFVMTIAKINFKSTYNVHTTTRLLGSKMILSLHFIFRQSRRKFFKT